MGGHADLGRRPRGEHEDRERGERAGTDGRQGHRLDVRRADPEPGGDGGPIRQRHGRCGGDEGGLRGLLLADHRRHGVQRGGVGHDYVLVRHGGA